MGEVVNALVIGGAGDGQRIIARGETLEVMEQADLRIITLEEVADLSEPVPIKRDRYRLEWIRSGSRKFALYVIDGMSHEDAMECLISGYKGAQA
jgi:hypothetical protein